MFESLFGPKKGGTPSKTTLLVRLFYLGPLLIVVTLALALLKLYLYPLWPPVWMVGVALSLACGALITALSFKEGVAFLTLSDQALVHKEEELAQLRLQVSEMQEQAAENQSAFQELGERYELALQNGRMFQELSVEAKRKAQGELAELKTSAAASLQELKSSYEQELTMLQEQLQRAQEPPSGSAAKKKGRTKRESAVKKDEVDEAAADDLFIVSP